MESVIISGNSKKDIKLLADIAQKMGLSVKYFTEDDIEDFVMAKAIAEDKTGELIDTDEFLISIK
ncbi:hypothetical protein [Mucilaginibacter sp.]|uniref:hypothetical protein n=1 Tax=Mucilaginibacter sp. TaxID=1882438 RepID=UPI002607B76F|nr:hypothetical protein [Mucilaginibacter sp.]MDB4922772.1 hypothetical protein [Mucilaginibacter sp.]